MNRDELSEKRIAKIMESITKRMNTGDTSVRAQMEKSTAYTRVGAYNLLYEASTHADANSYFEVIKFLHSTINHYAQECSPPEVTDLTNQLKEVLAVAKSEEKR